jgi:hypothetical protein
MSFVCGSSQQSNKKEAMATIKPDQMASRRKWATAFSGEMGIDLKDY